ACVRQRQPAGRAVFGDSRRGVRRGGGHGRADDDRTARISGRRDNGADRRAAFYLFAEAFEMTAVLEIKDVSVRLGGRDILRDVSLAVERGEIAALIGANGAGKTTLLKTANGGIEPASGRVFLGGRDIAEMSRREIARKAAVVAQENETKFPVSVEEFVLAGRFAHATGFGWERDEDIAAAEREMKACGLYELRGRTMNELSGGE